MTSKLYVMHHAPVPKRKGEIIGSRLDLGLNEYGIEVAHRQATRIARLIGNQTLENVGRIIISSPLKRALQTSEIIAEICDIPTIETDDRIKSQDFGILDGMTFDEIMSDDTLKLNLWENIRPTDRNEHCAPEGESNAAMVARVNDFKIDLLQQDQKNRPLVITHGTVIDALIAKIDQKRPDEVEGKNRIYEGRPLVISRNTYLPLGKRSSPFDFIPEFREVQSDDTDYIKQKVTGYINGCSRIDEKIHLEKLLSFLGEEL